MSKNLCNECHIYLCLPCYTACEGCILQIVFRYKRNWPHYNLIEKRAKELLADEGHLA